MASVAEELAERRVSENALVRDMVAAGRTNEEIAAALSLTTRAITSRLRALGIPPRKPSSNRNSNRSSNRSSRKSSVSRESSRESSQELGQEEEPDWARSVNAARIAVPVGEEKRADDYLRLSGDFLLLSDLHIPYHDAALLERALTDAERVGIRRFLILGDTMDANQFSRRAKHLGYQRRWQDDVEVAEGVFKALLSVMEGGVVIMGNHDAWYEKHYRGLADADWLFQRLLKTEERVTFSRYEQCEVESGGRRYRCLHGANYSGANPLGVGQRLSAKFECGIVMGHQHHHARGYSLSGRHAVLCLGGCHDPGKLSYLHVAPMTNPAQTRGYALLKEGYLKDVPIAHDSGSGAGSGAQGVPAWAR